MPRVKKRPGSGRASPVKAPAKAPAKPPAPVDPEMIGIPKSIVIPIRKGNLELWKGLKTLADKLGCRPPALMWVGVERLIADPPEVAPVGSTAPSRGNAAGYWVVPVMENGRAVSIKIVEVEHRGDVAGGRVGGFYRYDINDEETRIRARNQAIRAGQSDIGMLGLSIEDDLLLEEFDDDETEETEPVTVE